MLVSHSYPYLREEDKLALLECFELDYVGYDEDVATHIRNKLREYLSYNYIETTPSASLALLLILKFLDIKHDDEVILSAINCWSVYNSIIMEKATPIICDVRSCNDFRLSYKTIKDSITSKTRVVIITHMYGMLVEEEIIKKLKIDYPNIYIIEDFATSLFSKKDFKLGIYSDFAIGSFGSTKPLTGGIGGVLCSHKKILEPHYDRYEKSLIAFNVKISRVNQVLLLSQLNFFNEYQLIKKQIITFYQKFIKLYDSDDNIDLFRAITFDEPKALVDYLSTMDIELDIRVSVQPNLVKELNIKSKNNAYSFKKYYSIPLNIKAYEILKDKGLL
jgi:dTDP-4-amino-4,6-dideoxygalactose transaminase